MIAKKNPKTEARSANNAGALVDYILDAKGQGAKVLYSWATNCADPSDLALCAQEMVATQALNRRTERSKTYHLIVSLAPGERLDEGQLRRVEEHFCKALGLGDHQRIAAVHSDTQNLHMHLAISKIHPLTLNCVEPYRDYRKLQAACRELEAELGLKPGIYHDGGKEREAGRSGEVHRHMASFQTWLKQHIREGIPALMAPGNGWQALQDHLATFDVEVRERGAGFVFAHRSLKLFVKASAVDRSFSRGRLEEAFGPFDAAAKSSLPATMSYRAAPLAVSQDSDRLYQVYSQQREQAGTQRAAAWSAVKEKRAETVAEIKERYAARRLEVKLDRVIRKGRKHLVYKALAEQMKTEIQAAYQPPERAGANTANVPKVPGWRDWLHARAQAGDEGALGVLRHRGRPQVEPGVAVLSGTESKDSLFTGLPRSVSREGAVEYKAAKGSFIDYGRVVVIKSADSDVLKAAMLLAQAKFGASLRVESGHEIFVGAGLAKASEQQRVAPERKPERKPRGPER